MSGVAIRPDLGLHQQVAESFAVGELWLAPVVDRR